jgi:hypothetical protein
MKSRRLLKEDSKKVLHRPIETAPFIRTWTGPPAEQTQVPRVRRAPKGKVELVFNTCQTHRKMANKLIVVASLLAICGIGCGSLSTNSSPSPLAVVSTNPANGATGVPLSECPTIDSSGNPVGYCGGTIGVTFNRPVEAVTVNVSLKVMGTSSLLSGQMECTVPASASKYELCGPGVATTTTMLFVSSTNLQPGTVYQATISPTVGDCCIADSNGNVLSGLPVVWLYTTTVNASTLIDGTGGRLSHAIFQEANNYTGKFDFGFHITPSLSR